MICLRFRNKNLKIKLWAKYKKKSTSFIWSYGLFVREYRVGTRSNLYLTVTGIKIKMPKLIIIGQLGITCIN